jgi:hypothetical protein
MKHHGHTYGGFISASSERGMTVHMSVSLVNWSLATYRSFIPKGDIKIAAASALTLPHVLLEYTNQEDSYAVLSIWD